jgi:DNA-binding transcriptional regulator YhcF (GntR family)
MIEQIFVHINNERVELEGVEREAFIEERTRTQEDILNAKNVLKAEQNVKAAAKESAIAKLSALGLSEDEIKALVGA